MPLFYSCMCLCMCVLRRWKMEEEGRSADERLFIKKRESSLSLFSPFFWVGVEETKWDVALLFQGDERALVWGFQQKCQRSQTNLQMKHIKGAAPIVSLSYPGKIGSLRAKNDIVYINRGLWLDAAMFVVLCCPLPVPPLTNSPLHAHATQSLLWRLSFNGKREEWEEKEKDKHTITITRVHKQTW